MSKAWSFTELWNDSVISQNRPVVARDYCWASEIGGAYIDRYLRMTGVQPSNPPNIRSLRKFEAGNIIEWIVRFVLQRAGIIRDFQEEVWVEFPGLLKVKGKMDFIAGGYLDPERAKSDISGLYLPSSIEQTSLYIVEQLALKYGEEPLEVMPLEIKSCSSFVMDRMEKTESPIKKHVFQAFHYVLGLNMNVGSLAYICKDDMRMAEYKISNPSSIEKEYIADIKKLGQYLNNGMMPPPEHPVIFQPETGSFSKNLEIEYSPYLTMVYGFKTPREYSDSVSSKVARWNRVIDRYASGESITKANEEVKNEIKLAGWDFDQIVYMNKPTEQII